MQVKRSMIAAAGIAAASTLVVATALFTTSGADAAAGHHPTNQAAQHAAPKVEKILITGTSDSTQTVVAHGVFTGGGKDVQRGQSDKRFLGGGTILINHPNKQSHYVPTASNKKTCFSAFTITGKYTLSDGTGRFAGVKGHGTYKVHGQGIAKRNMAGKCMFRAEPRVSAIYINASGPASL